MSNIPPVAIVTGASRGAGRGIALALGSHGCTVYVTGRSERAGDASLPGTIHETAEAVTAAGGNGIAVRVDHADDAQVKALFAQVEEEQGRIDILINNACAIHDQLTTPGNFWEKPLEIGNMIDVGVRSGYVASWLAAPIMLRQERALVVFTSAPGAVHYCLGPAYGAHKAGVDKMAADMAVDFKDAGAEVTAVSIWMGTLLTERLQAIVANNSAKFGHVLDTAETPELTGHVIWALFNDPAVNEVSGQTLIGAELARKYCIKDKDGKQPPSVRELHQCEPRVQYPLIIK